MSLGLMRHSRILCWRQQQQQQRWASPLLRPKQHQEQQQLVTHNYQLIAFRLWSSDVRGGGDGGAIRGGVSNAATGRFSSFLSRWRSSLPSSSWTSITTTTTTSTVETLTALVGAQQQQQRSEWILQAMIPYTHHQPYPCHRMRAKVTAAIAAMVVTTTAVATWIHLSGTEQENEEETKEKDGGGGLWFNNNNNNVTGCSYYYTQCDTATAVVPPSPLAPADPEDDEDNNKNNQIMNDKATSTNKKKKKENKTSGMQHDAVGIYHGIFPQRQKWEPSLEYPLWDSNWDGRAPPPIIVTNDDDNNDKKTLVVAAQEEKKRMRQIRKEGVTRHILLIRHGQYEETHKEDELRILTPLGRRQAEYTGKRLARLFGELPWQQQQQRHGEEEDAAVMVTEGTDSEQPTPCAIQVLRVSGMTRAVETANIIASYLPDSVRYEAPDPLLNEGRPCHHIPGSKASDKTIQTTDEHHPRIEEAFQKYFYRAPPPLSVEKRPNEEDKDSDTRTTTTSDDKEQRPRHEFEIIVCHANVIRYFMCRALQLPPEVWLRYCPFNCSITYIMIRPTGTVTCRMMGDIGHLPYDMATFSQHHGFDW